MVIFIICNYRCCKHLLLRARFSKNSCKNAYELYDALLGLEVVAEPAAVFTGSLYNIVF